MSTIGGGSNSARDSPKDGDGENTKIAFQWQTLVDFVALVGRLFYDDACIVLLDFLAKEQKAFLEVDLREKLGWREALIQQKLYALEKHMLVTQDAGGTRNARSPVYWRINNNIYASVQFRYQQLVSRLTRLVEDAQRQHEFECSKESCPAKFTALEAACCVRALDDEHPLCSRCGSQLKPSEFQQTRIQAKEKCGRALTQLDPLKDGLLRIVNMEIPVFKPSTKDEKKEEQKEAAAAADAADETMINPSNEPQNITYPAAAATAAKPDGKQVQAVAAPVPTAPPKSTAPPVSRVIPWFDKTTMKSQIPAHTAAQQRPAAATGAPSKISFGLKQPIAKTRTTTSSMACSAGAGSYKPPVSVDHTTIPVAQPLQATTTITKESSAPPARVVIHNEVRVSVKSLGRSIKISEVTEEIEHMMTDEEYTIYYNATEVL